MRKWILRRKVLDYSSSQKISIGGNEYRSGHTLRLHGFSSNQRRRQLHSVVASQAMTLSQFYRTVDHKAIYREQNEVFSTILHEAAKHPIPFLLGQKPEQAQEELF
jgi:hypothetical protein